MANDDGFSSGVSYLGLGAPEEAQHKVVNPNDYYHSDMSDFTQLAYTALMKQQEQAFTEAMYNYNNWYNSDSQRMKRRSQAGLNPYGIEGSPAASAAAAPSAPVVRSSGTATKAVQTSLQSVIGLLSQAREVYDLLSVKQPLAEQQSKLLSHKIPAALAEADWLYWLTYGDDFGPNSLLVNNSPRASLFNTQKQAVAGRASQLEFLVKNLYPSQESRNKALEALDNYRLEVMKGQNDAILNINTGYDTLDGILRLLAYWLNNRTSLGF